MDVFTVLHISDLHIASRDTVISAFDLLRGHASAGKRIGFRTLTSHNPLMLEAAARFAYIEREQLDLILITGDLATSGRPSDLETALSFVDSPPSDRWVVNQTRGTLQGAARPIRLLPGNHDRYQNSLTHAAGGVDFDRIFTRYWKAGRGVQNQIVLQGAQQGEFLGIVSADLSLRDNRDAHGPVLSYLGQGRVYDNVLADLQRVTNDLREHAPKIAVVWSVHFPPQYPNIDESVRLLEEQKLLDLANAAEVQCIFSGHTHRALIYRCTNGVTVHCAGTSSHCASVNGNHLHLRRIHVDNGKIVTVDHVDYEWSIRDTAFIPADACSCK